MKRLYYLPILAISAMIGLFSCEGKHEFTINDFMVGDDYYIDTICEANGNLYCLLCNPTCGVNVLYDREGIIAYSSQLNVDSINGTTFNVSGFMKDIDVDFSNQESIERLKTQYPVYPDFKVECRAYEHKGNQAANYGLTAEVASGKVPHNKALNTWIKYNLGDSVYAIDYKTTVDSVASRAAAEFFSDLDEYGDSPYSELVYQMTQSALLYDLTDYYATFLFYTYYYTGGAHGMYALNLATFAFTDGKSVDQAYLFKPGTEGAVLELLYEAIANDKHWTEEHGEMTVEQVKDEIGELGASLPQPAITREGIVYCFQPYVIDCYAAGEYEFVIPISKLMPYFTDRAIALVGE